VSRWHRQLVARIPQAPEITADVPLEIAVARVLAYAPLPVGITRVHAELARAGRVADSRSLNAALQRSTFFARNGQGLWQLGVRDRPTIDQELNPA
jgi:hypothetical protein